MNQLTVRIDEGLYYRATVRYGGYLIIEKSRNLEVWEQLSDEAMPLAALSILVELLDT